MGFVFPNDFMTRVLHFSRSTKGLYCFVGWRLLFGLVLVISAPLSYYSTFFYIIGTLSLFGGLVTIMMGPRYVEHYLSWWQTRPAVWLRVIIIGLATGCGAGFHGD